MMGMPTELRIRWADLDYSVDCGVIQDRSLSSNSGHSAPIVLGK